jgi:hypothetical protein
LALIKALPKESAFVTATDPQAAVWGLSEHLLAAQLEAFVNANRDPKKSSKPFTIDRPGLEQKRSMRRYDPYSDDPQKALTQMLGGESP